MTVCYCACQHFCMRKLKIGQLLMRYYASITLTVYLLLRELYYLSHLLSGQSITITMVLHLLTACICRRFVIMLLYILSLYLLQ